MSDFFYEHCITRFLARILRLLNFHWICLSNSDVTLPDFGNLFYNLGNLIDKVLSSVSKFTLLSWWKSGGKAATKNRLGNMEKLRKILEVGWFFQNLFSKKNRYHRENLKQKLRVLQFCTLTLPSWLFLRKKLRYCINLIFYLSFFQNYTIIIVVLIFEKKHGSYRVKLCKKTENSVKNPTQW